MERTSRPAGLCGLGLRQLTCGLLGAALLGGLAVPAGASGDPSPLAGSAAVPWADRAHASALEMLAGRIASRIAGRTVTVRCQNDSDWASLIRARGGDPTAESGFVETTWDPATGRRLGSSSVAELSGRGVCLALGAFATAPTKPTKCTSATRATSAAKARRVAQPGPCYLGAGNAVRPMTPAFWAAYESYAVAILTLAHESIHLRGVVGGVLPNGLAIGDAQAEAKADCYGMQAMAAVAEQLGDTADDAQAIATYFWDKVYARSITSTHSQYWSAGCRPGGPLDIRPAGATSWP